MIVDTGLVFSVIIPSVSGPEAIIPSSNGPSPWLLTTYFLFPTTVRPSRYAIKSFVFHYTGGKLMISKSWSRKSIATAVAVAVLVFYSMVVLAAPNAKASGELSVCGQVTVNGQTLVFGGA